MHLMEYIAVFALLGLPISLLLSLRVLAGQDQKKRTMLLADMGKQRREDAKVNGSLMRLMGRTSDCNPFEPAATSEGLVLANCWATGWIETDLEMKRREKEAADGQAL